LKKRRLALRNEFSDSPVDRIRQDCHSVHDSFCPLIARRTNEGLSMRPIRFALLLLTLPSIMAKAQSVEGHGAVNFDKVNACARKQTAPTPCSRTSKLKYNVTATTTFGWTRVVTQGSPGLDFTLSSTGCVGTLAAGSSCSVTVKFAPLSVGVRMGAVQLTDSSGNLLASTFVYGNGQAPVAAFNPGVQRNLPTVEYDGGAIAAGAGGDVFFSAHGSIAKFNTRTGVQTTVAPGVPYAVGLAVDGAGNIFVSNNGMVKIAADTGVQTPVGKDLNASVGAAVDGRGNLYVGDDWDIPIHGLIGWPRLAEISAATGEEETLLTGSAGDEGNPIINYPWGVAVDGAGNAYIACFNFGPVFESIAGTPPESGGGIIASRQFTLVGNFNNPNSVTVDAAGDVFVADGGFDPNGIYEVAAGSGNETVVVSGLWQVSIAVDGAGNLFFPGTSTLAEMKGSQPAALYFGKVAVGSTSAPKSITIQNVGNQPLNAIAPGLIVGTNFLQVPGSGTPLDCTSSFSLAPGASCNLSIVFAPQASGKITGTATFTDNALNKIPSASQSVQLRGTGTE
jgi:hypothetical protein